ncbi:DUF1385 domain-containing protein [candidate division KSB1 bacterium]|nr:DUF1385 domain-containing protein [candidate division KSB1 bacterium]
MTEDLKKESKAQVGGQAVMEGVMMRSPHTVSVAVRKADGTIILQKKPYESLTKRNKILGMPIFRGGIILIESMVLGIKALTYSGDIAMQDEKQKDAKEESSSENKKKESLLSKLWMVFMVIFSFGIGLLIFFYIPLVLTELLGAESGLMFNLIDGVIRLAFFLAYLFLISQWKEIRRIFEYHGAEHKSIFAFENTGETTVQAANQYKTFHPRCGTSFLMIVLLVSIVVFVFLGKPDTIGERLLRLAFVPVIGGLSYELIKLSDKFSKNPIVRLFILPGLWLQRITTREPDEKQLEVAIVALKAALGKDLPENVVLDES